MIWIKPASTLLCLDAYEKGRVEMVKGREGMVMVAGVREMEVWGLGGLEREAGVVGVEMELGVMVKEEWVGTGWEGLGKLQMKDRLHWSDRITYVFLDGLLGTHAHILLSNLEIKICVCSRVLLILQHERLLNS